MGGIAGLAPAATGIASARTGSPSTVRTPRPNSLARIAPAKALLEIRAGAPTHKGIHTGVFATRQRMRAAERQLAAQAEAAYRRTVADWHATQAKRKGAGATPGRASSGPSSGQAARQVQVPGPAL